MGWWGWTVRPTQPRLRGGNLLQPTHDFALLPEGHDEQRGSLPDGSSDIRQLSDSRRRAPNTDDAEGSLRSKTRSTRSQSRPTRLEPRRNTQHDITCLVKGATIALAVDFVEDVLAVETKLPRAVLKFGSIPKQHIENRNRRQP